MAYIPRSSFIPKETTSVPTQIRRKRTLNLFSLIGSTLLIASLLGVLGIYLYSGILNKRLETAKSALNEASSEDSDAKIAEIRSFDEKLSIANTLLENHISASRIFEELESSTKETVQFKTLDFTYEPGYDATIVLSGNTEEFSSVALQKLQLQKDNLFSDFRVREITLAEKDDTATDDPQDTPTEFEGKVSFQVTGVFKEGVLDYTGNSSSVVSEVSDEVEEVVAEPDTTITETATRTIPDVGEIIDNRQILP